MVQHMNKNGKIFFIVATLVVVSILAWLWSTTYTPEFLPFRHRPPMNDISGDIELFYTIKTVVCSMNTALLIILLITFIDIYRKIKSEFTIGLAIFSTALLFYSLTSNPILHSIFGFYAYGLGPFAMLPDLFTFLALIVLLYLSLKY